MSSLVVPICIIIIKKCFQSQLNTSMSKVLLFCGTAFFADLVVCDGIRYVLSSGTNTILFLPACLPICFMLIMFYSTKDTGKDKSAEKRLTYLVGIPLLLMSLYFEVLSFLQI